MVLVIYSKTTNAIPYASVSSGRYWGFTLRQLIPSRALASHQDGIGDLLQDKLSHPVRLCLIRMVLVFYSKTNYAIPCASVSSGWY
ncbi:hypothetical protein PoB_007433100 [Plakobranchus ocellatus]|uniref:Uncharacterized protein n=1 Tax=Plakobranchus ocellatus TaxID=259542 RepID=A0AAV4DUQ1_9GAST|nr:hypothetical protein PoB_007433100 [Plakobranchus ocellatus]